MPFTRDLFLKHRPWLYHFTTADNVGLLRRHGAMFSAAEWVTRANDYRMQVVAPDNFLGQPRLNPRTLEIERGSCVTLNDQLPLRHEIHRVMHHISTRFPERMSDSLAEHVAIASALLSGDGPTASEKMTAHLRNGLQSVYHRAP